MAAVRDAEDSGVAMGAVWVAAPEAQGMLKPKVAPGPTLAIAHSFPLWLSMIERLIARPMPRPCALVV